MNPAADMNPEMLDQLVLNQENSRTNLDSLDLPSSELAVKECVGVVFGAASGSVRNEWTIRTSPPWSVQWMD